MLCEIEHAYAGRFQYSLNQASRNLPTDGRKLCRTYLLARSGPSMRLLLLPRSVAAVVGASVSGHCWFTCDSSVVAVYSNYFNNISPLIQAFFRRKPGRHLLLQRAPPASLNLLLAHVLGEFQGLFLRFEWSGSAGIAATRVMCDHVKALFGVFPVQSLRAPCGARDRGKGTGRRSEPLASSTASTSALRNDKLRGDAEYPRGWCSKHSFQVCAATSPSSSRHS